MIGGTRHNSPLNKAISVKDLNIDSRYGLVYEAIVKDVKDVTMHGRLRVWIPEISGSEDDESGWIPAHYSSPFAGSTNVNDNKNAIENSDVTQSSYGFWAVPPDVGNVVLVLFASGRMDRCYWFSCVYQQYMNHSVPGVAASANNYKDSGKELPVSEYNKHDKAPNIKNPKRPAHKDKIKEIGKQGLLLDKIRGINKSSARRETPSMVFGMSTPGPLSSTKGKRTGGHSIIFDDNIDNEHMTLETRQGSKIKLDDTNGLIYIINKDGTGWVEIDADGKIMVFGASDFAVRAKGNIDLYSDKNVNIEAKESINVKSGNSIGIETIALSEKSATHRIEASTVSIKSDNINVTDAGKLSSSGEHYAVDFKTAEYSLNGHEHMYNPGPNPPTPTASKLPGPGTSTPGPAATVKSVAPKTDIAEGFSDSNWYNRESSEIDTIVSILPTYEPCPDHTKK